MPKLKRGLVMWNGLKVSKTVIAKYEKGEYGDKTLINHIMKYNRQIKKKMEIDGSFRDFITAEMKYGTEHGYSNRDKLDNLQGLLRSKKGVWKDETNSYLASFSETYDQWNVNEKRKLMRKYGAIDLFTAQYNENTGALEVKTVKGYTIEMWINSHVKGEYEDGVISWQEKK